MASRRRFDPPLASPTVARARRRHLRAAAATSLPPMSTPQAHAGRMQGDDEDTVDREPATSSHYTQCPLCQDHFPTFFIQTHAHECTSTTRETEFARHHDEQARHLAEEERRIKAAGFTGHHSSDADELCDDALLSVDLDAAAAAAAPTVAASIAAADSEAGELFDDALLSLDLGALLSRPDGAAAQVLDGTQASASRRLSDDQLTRMEKNRQAALARRAKRSAQAVGQPTASAPATKRADNSASPLRVRWADEQLQHETEQRRSHDTETGLHETGLQACISVNEEDSPLTNWTFGRSDGQATTAAALARVAQRAASGYYDDADRAQRVRQDASLARRIRQLEWVDAAPRADNVFGSGAQDDLSQRILSQTTHSSEAEGSDDTSSEDDGNGGWLLTFKPCALVPISEDRLPAIRAIREAAAARESLGIILVGTLITLPMIVGYSIFAYRVFRGKATLLSYS